MPVGLVPLETEHRFSGERFSIRKYKINARAGHPSRFALDLGSGAIPESAFLVDTGADLNILPCFMIRHFIDPKKSFDHDELNKFWLDDKREDWDVFQKVRQIVADGTPTVMPLVCTRGTLKVRLTDGGLREIKRALFTFSPSGDLLERYLKKQGRLKKDESIPDPAEVLIVGRQALQQMRLFMPSNGEEDEVVAQLVFTSENVSVHCNPFGKPS